MACPVGVVPCVAWRVRLGWCPALRGVSDRRTTSSSWPTSGGASPRAAWFRAGPGGSGWYRFGQGSRVRRRSGPLSRVASSRIEARSCTCAGWTSAPTFGYATVGSARTVPADPSGVLAARVGPRRWRNLLPRRPRFGSSVTQATSPFPGGREVTARQGALPVVSGRVRQQRAPPQRPGVGRWHGVVPRGGAWPRRGVGP